MRLVQDVAVNFANFLTVNEVLPRHVVILTLHLLTLDTFHLHVAFAICLRISRLLPALSRYSQNCGREFLATLDFWLAISESFRRGCRLRNRQWCA